MHHQEELALILRTLPDEMMVEVLGHLSPYALGAVACVCRSWRTLATAPRLWKAACSQAFKQQYDEMAMVREVATNHNNSWRDMFMTIPHLRFDGLYVSRNSYCRVGVIEMRERKPVHLVSYYRYWRFFDDGTLNYRTSPLTVGKVYKTLRPRIQSDKQRGKVSGSTQNSFNGDSVFRGRWILEGNKLFVVIVYPNSRSTEIRMVVRLRSTSPGANNRLDISSIVSYDRELGAGTSMLAQVNNEGEEGVDALPDPLIEAAPLAPGREHNRGKATASMVPWDQVGTSILNLPPSQMDYYNPG